MRRKSQVHLVRNKGNAPGPISTLSNDEQTHLLDLADTALHQKRPDDTPFAGSRFQQEHKRLVNELKDQVEQMDEQRSGGKDDAA
jgi:hypothetical protein